MIRYAIALAVLLIIAAAFSWAFLPAVPARQPGPAPADPAAPAAASGQGVRHGVARKRAGDVLQRLDDDRVRVGKRAERTDRLLQVIPAD